MITADADFITAVGQNGRHFAAKIYNNGSEVTCDIISITSKKGAQDGQSFTAGAVFSSSLEITCSNLSVALENEDIEVKIGILTNRANDTYKYITYGKYTVIRAQKNQYQTVLKCVGFISSKFNEALPDMTTPTLSAVATAIGTATGVTVSFVGVSSGTTNTLAEDLKGITCRSALSIIAFAVGGYATENSTGGVEIHQFAIPSSTYALSAENCLAPPVVAEDSFDMTGIKVIAQSSAYFLTSDSIVVSGKTYYTRSGTGTSDDPYIYTEVETPSGNPASQGWYELGEISYTSGSPIRQTYENKYVSQSVFNTLVAVLVGYEFDPAEIDMSLGDPRLEPWDCLTVTDVDGATTHTVPCHLIESTFDGGFSSKIYAIGESESDTEVTGSLSESVKRVITLSEQTSEASARAYAIAKIAKTSADGKNKIYYSASTPTGGTYNIGDTWFNSSEDNAIYTWSGSAWVKEELGEDAIANLSITNAKIADATIQSAKIGNVDVAKLTGGYIDASHIDASSITIGESQVTNLTTDLASKAEKSDAIASVTTKDQYYLSTSSSSATGGSWQDTVPTWSSGKYIWTRVSTTKTTVSGTSTTTTSTAVYDSALTSALSTASSAQTSANSSASTVVTTKQYYLSTSSSSATGGSWGSSVPAWTSGKYIWTRYEIVTTTVGGTSTTTYSPSSAGVYDATMTDQIQDALDSCMEVKTASGSIISINDASEYPALELTTDINPIQDLNGYNAPWVGGAGKNKIPQPTNPINMISVVGLTFTTNTNGSLKAFGTVTTAGDYTLYDSTVDGSGINDGFTGSYILSGSTNGSSSTYRMACRIRDTSASTNRYVTAPDGDSATITTSANEVINRIYITFNNGVNVDTTFYPMLRLSSVSDSTYAPYSNICPISGSTEVNTYVNTTHTTTGADTYTTPLGRTVYGGTLDVVSGVLTVTHKKLTLDGTQTLTDRISSQNRVWIILNDMLAGSALDDNLSKCDKLPKVTVPNSYPYAGMGIGSQGNSAIYITGVSYISGVTDLASLNTWLTNNPVTLTYPLATPQTYQVTPQQIMMLQGTNYVWTDTGDVSIQYAIIADSAVDALREPISNASKTATSYITAIDEGGIKVHDASDTDNYTLITSDGQDVVVDNVSVAHYGATARVGENSKFHTVLNQYAAKFHNGNRASEIGFSPNRHALSASRSFIYNLFGTDNVEAYFTAPLDVTSVTFKLGYYDDDTITLSASEYDATATNEWQFTGHLLYKDAYLYRLSNTDFYVTLHDDNYYTPQYMIEVTYTLVDMLKYATSGNIVLAYGSGSYMTDTQTWWLHEPVSTQYSGIVLVWSAYENGEAQDYDWNHTYIAKDQVSKHSGTGVSSGLMTSASLHKVGAKYIYVYDNKIVGNQYNNTSGTKNGITYDNSYWVLRYVIGV